MVLQIDPAAVQRAHMERVANGAADVMANPVFVRVHYGDACCPERRAVIGFYMTNGNWTAEVSLHDDQTPQALAYRLVQAMEWLEWSRGYYNEDPL